MWATRSTWRDHWPEVAWAAFAVVNVGLMLAVPTWQAIPFHLIWVSLTVLYGFRLWAPKPTVLLLLGVGALTGAAVLVAGQPAAARANEFAEVPLMSSMFMVMVWHARRRSEALTQVRLAADRERDFISDASHRLRTPITVARGHAELIQERSESGSATERDAEIVIGELVRLGSISERLLILASAAHPGFLVRERVPLRELVSSTAERWTAAADRGWLVDASATGVVLVDRERVDCAIDALVENAVKATGPGDPIALRASIEHGTAVITIADRGVGVAPQDHERIFERFARVPDPRGNTRNGTGLGLPMVKAIAGAHGGSVTVSSEPEGWTTFELRLGRLEPDARHASTNGAERRPDEHAVTSR
jgi:two-component system OmpR family sensor kinase